MDNLYNSFLAEANELLENIERGLLQLENDPRNKEGISAVFRSMHTLKGSAGMFGLEAMNKLTHELETIYDDIRENAKPLTKEILSISFKSLDHLRKILNDPDLKGKKLSSEHNQLLDAIIKLSQKGEKSIKSGTSIEEPKCLYYVQYVPSSEDLANGTNPFFVLEDLLATGETHVIPTFSELPTLDQLDPSSNYTAFEVILLSEKSSQDLNDIFIFSSPSTQITIKEISQTIKSIPTEIKNTIDQMNKSDGLIGFETIRELFVTEEVRNTEGEISEKSNGSGSKSSIRVDSERIDELMNLISELVTTQAQLTTFSNSLNSPHLSFIGESIEKISRRLRDNAFRMGLIPIETLIFRFQRLVRDLSEELTKKVSFITEGTETEIDKSIVEKLTDPILHIIRNSLDHGIELPDKRVAAGKTPQGTIKFKAYYSGANVVIEISDDGAGLPLQKIRKKAINKGLISIKEELSDHDIIDLIFSPGFSTAEMVTGVSGRGVGMDVVKRNISDLRGEIEVDTQAGQGTTFKIILPLTLSIIDGLLVQVGNTNYILPLQAVDKCYEVKTQYFRESFNHWVSLDDQRTPYIFLRDEFTIWETDPPYSQVIKISYKDRKIGLVVDSIIGEYQAVLKPLGDQYKKQDEFSGATILGDGSVALVIDPLRLTNKMMDNKLLN